MKQEFDLSKKMFTTKEIKDSKIMDDFEWVEEAELKEFIKKGDKIFLSEDYGNDDISNEMYDYVAKKWGKFKKHLGPKLI